MNKNNKGEFEIIETLTRFREKKTGFRENKDSSVLKGVGDDTAVVKSDDEGGDALLFTCDAQGENSHFLMDNILPYNLGRRVAAVNISDIAAMGGSPRWALVSLFLSKKADSEYLKKMYDGLYFELDKYEVSLVGGNIIGNRESFCVDMFLVGKMDRTKVLGRNKAKPGQLVCVTGTLGDSAAGLALLQKGGGVNSDQQYLIHRHQLPTPRVEVGQFLASLQKTIACIDISDGLVQDASHVAKASGVCIEIHTSLLPLSSELISQADGIGKTCIDLALAGGEDYELMFSLDSNGAKDVIDSLFEKTGVKVTVVGKVKNSEEGEPLINIKGEGWDCDSSGGFDHVKGFAEK